MLPEKRFVPIAFAGLRSPEKRVNADRLAFTLDHDSIQLEGRKAADPLLDRRADHDVDVAGLRLTFEARRQVHRVAYRGVVEATSGAHVSHHAGPRVDTDPHSQRLKFRPALARGGLQKRVQVAKLVHHRQSRLAGVDRKIGIGERRIPEGDDAVTDVFVDHAALGEDNLGHGGEKFVDQMGECLGIALIPLRERSEVTYVAKSGTTSP